MSFLQDALYNSFIKHKDLQALSVQNTKYSYQEILDYTCAFDNILGNQTLDKIVILGDRSLTSYLGVAYSLLSGSTFVPINPAFPIEQNSKIIQLSDAKTIIFDITGLQTIKSIASHIRTPLKLLTFSHTDHCSREINAAVKEFEDTIHTLHIAKPPNNKKGFQPNETSEEKELYILFTSGTTGTPKGVPITHGNIESYLTGINEILKLSTNDRFSQTFDLTFDLSMHDIFLSWFVGGCLCVPARLEMLAPKRYIEREQITVWFSVPSAAVMMKQMKQLEPNSYPTIQHSLFCGEALPANLASTWQTAAPNSKITNLYGPTEATIAFTHHEFKDTPETTHINGIVAIGNPFGDNKAAVYNDNLDLLPIGEEGELCLSGKQITPGYLNNKQQNSERFFIEEKTGTKWYRTGDRVYYDKEDGYIYMGRMDHQIKILGYRVELIEIENVLRSISDTEHVAAIPWPITNGLIQGIVAFIVNPDIDINVMKEQCKLELAHYKRPSSIYKLDAMPLNSNGKIDRNKLKQHLMESK